MASNRVNNTLSRDAYILEDESNPRVSKVDQVYLSTVLDQVFDDLSPTNKTLREIIEDLRQEIITGGRGNIVFPVTSVNGKTEDVVLAASDFGLGRVDNTRDADKPLSVPQKESIMKILENYDFNVNFSDLYNHLMDTSNPHDVNIEQINKDNQMEEFVQRLIGLHNNSVNTNVHMDLRRSLSALWVLVDDINNNLEDRVGSVLNAMDTHQGDPLAHLHLFDLKEDIKNKAFGFSTTTNSDHTLYPSTRAVVEFVNERLDNFKDDELPAIRDCIHDLLIIKNRSELPAPTEKFWHKAYFINEGNDSHNEVAICRQNSDGKTYSWDISSFGTFTKFDKKYFVDDTQGLTLRMENILDDMIKENGMLDTSISEMLSHYYTKEEIDNLKFMKKVNIIPGTMDGTIRYYVNDDMLTMSDDVKVSGLKRLAYMDWVYEDQIWDQSIHSNHIINKAIEHRHLQNNIVGVENISCKYGSIIGNTDDSTGNNTNEISLMQLADYIRPLIGGWPDPTTPGGNPWQEYLDERLMHPHLWKPDIEHNLGDHSYAIRFTGTISVIPNMDFKVHLTNKITLGDYRIIDAGGTWQYQSDPDEWTIFGGSNITGHTFATVNQTKDGLFFESISIGNRWEAEYDIWVKYIKTAEMNSVKLR